MWNKNTIQYNTYSMQHHFRKYSTCDAIYGLCSQGSECWKCGMWEWPCGMACGTRSAGMTEVGLEWRLAFSSHSGLMHSAFHSTFYIHRSQNSGILVVEQISVGQESNVIIYHFIVRNVNDTKHHFRRTCPCYTMHQALLLRCLQV
jgi:hypothetical protein